MKQFKFFQCCFQDAFVSWHSFCFSHVFEFRAVHLLPQIISRSRELTRVNPKLNLFLILCPEKTPLAGYTVLSPQSPHHSHQFTVFTPVWMLLVSRSELRTVTSAEKSCPRLIQHSVYFLFHFSFLIPLLEHICLNSVGLSGLAVAGHHQTTKGPAAITTNPTKK